MDEVKDGWVVKPQNVKKVKITAPYCITLLCRNNESLCTKFKIFGGVGAGLTDELSAMLCSSTVLVGPKYCISFFANFEPDMLVK
jgi:hypothetical protein